MADEHNVVSIQGSLPGGEVWSINPRFRGAFSPPVRDYEELLAWATAIGELNSNTVLPAGVRQLLSSAAHVTQIRVAHIGTNGRTEQVAEYTLPTPAAGTGNATKPFQAALCFSLLTGRPGRRNRGRLFMPALAAVIGVSDLRITAQNRSTYLQGMVDLLTGIQGAVTTGQEMVLAVFSQVQGAANLVTDIELGDLLDTQRRRRDSLTEQRSRLEYPSAV